MPCCSFTKISSFATVLSSVISTTSIQVYNSMSNHLNPPKIVREAILVSFDYIHLLFFGILVLIGVSAVSLSILFGPMVVGYTFMVLNLLRKKRRDGGDKAYAAVDYQPEMGDIFRGFEYLVPSVSFFLPCSLVLMFVNAIINALPYVGGSIVAVALSYLAGLAVSVFTLPAAALIVDQRLSAIQAFKKCKSFALTNYIDLLFIVLLSSLPLFAASVLGMLFLKLLWVTVGMFFSTMILVAAGATTYLDAEIE